MIEVEYAEFLVSRIFSANGYGTVDALLREIDRANLVEEWREQKRVFNSIEEKAPMVDEGGYSLSYCDVPEFIRSECSSFGEFLSSDVDC
jgi:hypothetical protein